MASESDSDSSDPKVAGTSFRRHNDVKFDITGLLTKSVNSESSIIIVTTYLK